MAAAELDKGKIVGQLPAGSGTPEQFGLVLDKDSPLTDLREPGGRRAARPTARSTSWSTQWLARAARRSSSAP